METKVKRFETTLGGETLIIETGRMAKQADGACMVQLGGTAVLVTAVCSEEPRKDIDFFPLTVEYQERTYAAGKIPGGFFKREGRPSEKEILTARLIDRPIRPLFPKGFINEVQIVALVLSSDMEHDSDVLAMVGAATALGISDIPFDGPIAAVRVGRIGGQFVINPTFQQLVESDLDLVVAGSRSGVLMVESEIKELSEDDVLAAIDFGQQHLQGILELQEKAIAACGKPKRKVTLYAVSDELLQNVRAASIARFGEINRLTTKEGRAEAMHQLAKELIEKFATEDSGHTEKDVKNALAEIEEEEVRKLVLGQKRRVDGRRFDEIRPITCEVGLLSRTHGSSLFTRGQTQSLAVTTLGTSADEQRIDALEGEMQKSFMLHYNFPPFSVGEVKPIRGPGRREIGHGALAERALKAVMPSKDTFPYTVRVVSDILESNGSSSMATVCASSLSLMDAGVPISSPVSGIAMGLIKSDREEAILIDIAGVEDHYGDMDFKVAGTKKGITALQMDLKVTFVSLDLLKRALAMSKTARAFIMEKMIQVIDKPKESVSEFAPRIVTIKLPQDKIGEVIGPGGKVIKKIIQDTGVTMDIDDDGTCQIGSTDAAALEKAAAIVRGIIAEPEIGAVYNGTITRLMNFGAFCEFMPNKEGLIHVSELADGFVKNVEDAVKVGDAVTVKVIEIDDQGRINLSRKQASPDWTEEKAKAYAEEKAKHRDEGRSGGRRPPPRHRRS